MEQVSQSFASTYSSLMGWSLHWWLGDDRPGLPALRNQMGDLRPVSIWAGAAVLAVSLVASAVLVMLRRRGEDLAAMLLVLGRVALMVSGGWLLLSSSWSLGDALSNWILGQRGGVAEYRAEVTQAMSQADPAVAMMLSIVGIATCLGFVAVVLVRFVIAGLLAIGMPVLAAAGGRLGVHARRVAWGWAVAVVAFQPVSAVLYRIGHGLALQVQEPVLVLLISALTFFLAAGSLPALARIAGSPR